MSDPFEYTKTQYDFLDESLEAGKSIWICYNHNNQIFITSKHPLYFNRMKVAFKFKVKPPERISEPTIIKSYAI